MSALTVVSYDKVRGPNKAQQWTRSVCVRFFITTITQPDTISQDTILIERLVYVAYASTRVVVLIERLVFVAYASTRVVDLIERLVYVAYASTRVVVLIERLVYVAYTFTRVIVLIKV